MTSRHPSGQPKHSTRFGQIDRPEDGSEPDSFLQRSFDVLVPILIMVGLALCIKFAPGS